MLVSSDSLPIKNNKLNPVTNKILTFTQKLKNQTEPPPPQKKKQKKPTTKTKNQPNNKKQTINPYCLDFGVTIVKTKKRLK